MSSASLLSDRSPYLPGHDATVLSPSDAGTPAWLQGLARRWRRERRRRKVGRAYDMALEIARLIPRNSTVLDVGCGNGYIAHHLSALLGAHILGIDLNDRSEAPIEFRRFDGRHFPVADRSFDAALFCYVLHHAQDLDAIMLELHRVLCKGGSVLVYEDIPARWWDRFICCIHNLKWRKRTGPCTFRNVDGWQELFDENGFEVVSEKRLSRWRNLAHPVARRIYVLKKSAEC